MKVIVFDVKELKIIKTSQFNVGIKFVGRVGQITDIKFDYKILLKFFVNGMSIFMDARLKNNNYSSGSLINGLPFRNHELHSVKSGADQNMCFRDQNTPW